MSHGWIIWSEPRTAGTTFSAALKAVSRRPSAPDEPFQYGARPNIWAWIYEAWCVDGDPAALYRALSTGACFKHIPEAFDDNFNADLARAAEYHGYRHIKLVRCNTFARLVSRGVAEQLDAWSGPSASTRELAPMDVPHLIEDLRLGAARWRAVVPWLTAVLVVKTEDVTSEHAGRRHECLARVLRFLGIPRKQMRVLDERLARGPQNTSLIASRVPNLGELRRALMTEGAA
jgi:hypothetical protein